MRSITPPFAALAVALAVACAPAPAGPAARAGGGGTPSAGSAGAGAGASAAGVGGGAAASGSAAGAVAAPETSALPEKGTLTIGAVLTGSLYLPLIVADEGGYFAAHGLSVEVSGLAASAAAQALVAGSVDMYLGGATAIAAHLAGNDVIYVGAAVDKSSLMLLGEPGIRSFPDFRGKTIATTSPGAFGEIALFQTAKEFGMRPGEDFALNYSTNSETVYAAFVSKATQGAITSPPSSLRLLDEGYPLVIDYYQRGLKIVGPGVSVARSFTRTHPNTIKAFLRAYLDATKRVFDDPAYATDVTRRFTKLRVVLNTSGLTLVPLAS